MPITYGEAKSQMLAVVTQLARYIDPEVRSHLVHRLHKGHSREFFVILDLVTWSQDVTTFYNAYFSRVIGPGLLQAVLAHCHGFTTPFGHAQRRLFVPVNASIGTLVHEFVHWLQHKNAYPTFYQNDRDGAFFLEGVTEYFTRKVYDGVDRGGHYEVQLAAVHEALEAGVVSEQALAAFAFRGAGFPEALRPYREG